MLVKFRNIYGAVQIGSEFSWLLDKILTLKSRKVAVEIGVYKGGTFYAFMQFFDKVIGIDIKERNLPFKLRTDDQYIIGSSRDLNIVSKIQNNIDFLFIDGDHSYEGVLRDFNLWGPKVKKDGIIAFHDIVGADINGYKYGVRDFWNEIKKNYDTEEKKSHEKYFGIGIIKK